MKSYVYILASKKNGTTYTGVTNNLKRRVLEHKNKTIKGFTQKYNVNMLVWSEEFENISEAISWEKKIKNRNRKYKLGLIESKNPLWNDLINLI